MVLVKKRFSGSESRWTIPLARGCQSSIYFFSMKQLLLELPDEIADELERVAPGRARQRSAFLRLAVRQALDRVAEERMAAAYRAQPDVSEPAYLDPSAWEPREAKRPTRARKR